ncbi:MAG: sugar phosphate isomerase/epimerase [Armatimonadetes bacterium]|nr:sugar phosphate isomerase/epimerase [Armatimonadota bacterium]
MDIICASICYRGYEDDEVAGTLQNAPALGYRFMEIHGPMVWSAEAVARFDLEKMKREVAASGMVCRGLYPPGWGGVDDADVTVRAQAIAQCVEYTRALGGTHISTSGAEPHGTDGALERVIDCAAQVLDLVPEDSPILLTLEPHFGNVLQEWEDFAEVMKALPDPRLGICVDTGHFHSAGVDTIGFIRQFAERIYAVHLKDHIGRVSVGIGRGEIDLGAKIEVLQDVGYWGGLTVELEVGDPQNLPRYTAEAYVYLSGLLGQKL